MRRFFLVIEVLDKGEPSSDGTPLYAFNSAEQIGREIKHHIKDPFVSIIVHFAEELIP